MNDLSAMLWVELRKAIRSRMPLWTSLGSMFFPLGIAFLLFVSKNPTISQKLGLVSAKADLMAYAATDWPTYMVAYGQIIALGEFFLLILAVSWIFGREFADGTLKDMLAVPVPREHPAGKIYRAGTLGGTADRGHIHLRPVDGCGAQTAGSYKRGDSSRQWYRDHNRLPDHGIGAAICTLRQHRAGILAARWAGSANVDDNEPGGDHRARRIPSPGQSLCYMPRGKAPWHR